MFKSTTVIGAVALAAATAFACGPSKPPEQPEPGPGTEPTDQPEPGPSSEPGAGGGKPGPDQPEPGPGPKSTVDPVPVVETKMVEDLKKIGIDLKNVPQLQKLPLAKKKKVMDLFVKSLGFENCQGCHVEGDFKKETKNIKLARSMWNEFVVKLRDAKGGTLFCDSCHNGKEHMIPRGDQDAVQKFMETEYEGKLTRADGSDHSCSSCHDDAFEPKIFEKLWKIQ
jgi:hypothetical protein